MGQAQINVRTWACSRTSIARTKQAALTHNVRGKELRYTEYSAQNGIKKSYYQRHPFWFVNRLIQENSNGEGVACMICQSIL